MSEEMKIQKETAAAWFRQLRDDIVAAFETLESGQTEGPTASLPAGRFEVTETTPSAEDGESGFLFQLMCVLGQWERAVNQLKVAGGIDPATLPMVQAFERKFLAAGVPAGNIHFEEFNFR